MQTDQFCDVVDEKVQSAHSLRELDCRQHEACSFADFAVQHCSGQRRIDVEEQSVLLGSLHEKEAGLRRQLCEDKQEAGLSLVVARCHYGLSIMLSASTTVHIDILLVIVALWMGWCLFTHSPLIGLPMPIVASTRHK
jgi:hypothetical protein